MHTIVLHATSLDLDQKHPISFQSVWTGTLSDLLVLKTLRISGGAHQYRISVNRGRRGALAHDTEFTGHSGNFRTVIECTVRPFPLNKSVPVPIALKRVEESLINTGWQVPRKPFTLSEPSYVRKLSNTNEPTAETKQTPPITDTAAAA